MSALSGNYISNELVHAANKDVYDVDTAYGKDLPRKNLITDVREVENETRGDHLDDSDIKVCAKRTCRNLCCSSRCSFTTLT
ncbi:hypothetical protein DPMN_132459 [Dreissena polymorpha]|uniref:Uncharacterized protein n=1 Tax=Dreissena polymorpha TaxID=45954 RepID=A0A9D4FTE8_DREPO|nr:hypothetical protein DPMN_132459 [Dreissena polymorpha]